MKGRILPTKQESDTTGKTVLTTYMQEIICLLSVKLLQHPFFFPSESIAHFDCGQGF